MAKNWIVFGSVICALFVGVGRFFVPGHELSLVGTYEATAHILVGAMLLIVLSPRFMKAERWTVGIALIVITTLETVMFMNR